MSSTEVMRTEMMISRWFIPYAVNTKTVHSMVMAYWKPEHLHAAASCATEIQVVFDRNNSLFHCFNERMIMTGV